MSLIINIFPDVITEAQRWKVASFQIYLLTHLAVYPFIFPLQILIGHILWSMGLACEDGCHTIPCLSGAHSGAS